MLRRKLMGGRMQPMYKTVSGSVANFSTIREAPLQSLIANIDCIQEGSGDPTPDNIRSINGYNQVKAHLNIYNMLDQSELLQMTNWVQSTDEGFITYGAFNAPVYKGTIRNLYDYGLIKQFELQDTKPNEQYVISYWWRSVEATTANGMRLVVYYDDGTSYTTGTQSANQVWTRQSVTTNGTKRPTKIRFSYNSSFTVYFAGLSCVPKTLYDLLPSDTVFTNDIITYTINMPSDSGKNLATPLKRGAYDYTTGIFKIYSTWITTDKIKCLPNTTYIASWGNGYTTRSQGYVWYDSNNNYISSTTQTATATTGFSATSPTNAEYFIYNIAGTTSSTAILPTDISEFQIEQGNIATSYEPFANDIYGGTLDVINGTLIVDWVSVEYDGSTDENWTVGSNMRYTIAPTLKPYYVRASAEYIKGSTSKPTSAQGIGSSMEDRCCVYGANTIGILKASIQNDVSAFKEFLAEHPAQLVYKLATPVTYQLTPIQVNTLLGMNNIWANSGDVTVTYQFN